MVETLFYKPVSKSLDLTGHLIFWKILYIYIYKQKQRVWALPNFDILMYISLVVQLQEKSTRNLRDVFL